MTHRMSDETGHPVRTLRLAAHGWDIETAAAAAERCTDADGCPRMNAAMMIALAAGLGMGRCEGMVLVGRYATTTRMNQDVASASAR